MREIKFRGKLSNSGKWAYGNLNINKVGTIIITPDETVLGTYGRVEKETIGQYTGLQDKNGTEIYEGDIVTGTKYPFMENEKQNYIGIVVFYEDAAQFGYEYKCVNKEKRGISNGINNEFVANKNLICEELEVIGNIYDNPELLKED